MLTESHSVKPEGQREKGVSSSSVQSVQANGLASGERKESQSSQAKQSIAAPSKEHQGQAFASDAVPASLSQTVHYSSQSATSTTEPVNEKATHSQTKVSSSVVKISKKVVMLHEGDSSGDEVPDDILLVQAEPQEVNLSEIKREAVSIANNIVEKAKAEFSKQTVVRDKSMSLEISDEELVERGDHSLMEDELLQLHQGEPTLASESAIEMQSSTPLADESRLEPPRDENLVMISSSESSQQLSEASRTTSSRPTSSEYDLTIIPEGTSTSNEYLTCATTTGTQSYVTVPTSQETSYFTAKSNMSQLSSEASETIILDDATCKSDDDGNEFDEQYMRTSQLDTDAVEPFNCDISVDVLRGTVPGSSAEPDNWELVPNEMTSSAAGSVLTSSATSSSGTKTLTDSFVLLDDSGPQSTTLLPENGSVTESTGEVDEAGDQEEFTYLEYGQNAYMSSLDKNLYTHVEVDEEGSEDNFEVKKLLLLQSSPLSLANKTENTETSSTTSSLKEFERLESDLIKERGDWPQSSGDFSVDSRHLESAKPEKGAHFDSSLDASLCDAEDNNESLNLSEVSQDTVTCIKNETLESTEVVNKLKTFSKSLDTEMQSTEIASSTKLRQMEMFDPLLEEKRIHSVENVASLMQVEEEFQFTASKDLSQLQVKQRMVESMTESFEGQSEDRPGPMLVSYHSDSERSMKDSFVAVGDQSEVMLSSLDSALNPVLECDFPSLDSSLIASTENGADLLQCDVQVSAPLSSQPPTAIGNGTVNSGTIA